LVVQLNAHLRQLGEIKRRQPRLYRALRKLLHMLRKQVSQPAPGKLFLRHEIVEPILEIDSEATRAAGKAALIPD
jgi:hypothetical protein